MSTAIILLTIGIFLSLGIGFLWGYFFAKNENIKKDK
jgi:uncharacterized protein YneF (UPF0154 family)